MGLAVLAGCGSARSGAPVPTRTLPPPQPLGRAIPVSEPVLGTGSITVGPIRTYAAGATAADPAPLYGTYVVAHVVETGGRLQATPNAFAVFVGAIGPLGTETLQGNAPRSGLGAGVLPSDVLAPGRSVSGDIVFDVGGAHGFLVYDEGGPAETAWRF